MCLYNIKPLRSSVVVNTLSKKPFAQAVEAVPFGAEVSHSLASANARRRLQADGRAVVASGERVTAPSESWQPCCVADSTLIDLHLGVTADEHALCILLSTFNV